MSNLSIDNKEYLFVEKYRPKNIDDIIVTDNMKDQLKQWKEDGEIPNILLASKSPGLGKSALAHTIINELEADALFVNASLERNMDLLRDKISGFVSTASFDGRPKIVILDEADGLNQNTVQPALRGFIEEFSKNARFILTCNYKEKLIEPVRNRLMLIDFDEMFSQNKAELVKKTYMRIKEVLENEKIEYAKEDLIWLIKHYYPSNRTILNKIQQLSQNKKLIINKDDIDTDKLLQEMITAITKNDFAVFKKSLEKMADPGMIYSLLYENIDDFPLMTRPEIIITIAKYQSFDSTVRDRLINAVACGLEVMQVLSKY